MLKEVQACLAAIAFLTRIPLPVCPSGDTLRRSTGYFPLAGLLLGAFLALAYALAGLVFPPMVVAALILGAEFLLTGGLHLDGLMDAADGLLSGRPVPRALEIMRDSRIGAQGALAAFCLLLLKFSLLAGLSPPGAYRLLAALPVAARLNLTVAMMFFPYLRTEGLGSAFRGAGWGELFLAVSWAAAALYLTLGVRGLVLGTFVVAAGLLFGLSIRRRLGGLTGDVYGALAELSEVFFLGLAGLL